MSLANTLNSDYFLNYADVKTYGDSWQTQMYVPHLVNLIHTHDLPIHTALILGAATGESLEFLRLNGIRAKGIEISEWAVDQARTKPICGDVCSVLPQLVEQGHFFDLIFSSCLQYVPDTEIKKLIPVIATERSFYSIWFCANAQPLFLEDVAVRFFMHDFMMPAT